jgi:hypothetical protein
MCVCLFCLPVPLRHYSMVLYAFGLIGHWLCSTSYSFLKAVGGWAEFHRAVLSACSMNIHPWWVFVLHARTVLLNLCE